MSASAHEGEKTELDTYSTNSFRILSCETCQAAAWTFYRGKLQTACMVRSETERSQTKTPQCCTVYLIWLPIIWRLLSAHLFRRKILNIFERKGSKKWSEQLTLWRVDYYSSEDPLRRITRTVTAHHWCSLRVNDVGRCSKSSRIMLHYFKKWHTKHFTGKIFEVNKAWRLRKKLYLVEVRLGLKNETVDFDIEHHVLHETSSDAV